MDIFIQKNYIFKAVESHQKPSHRTVGLPHSANRQSAHSVRDITPSYVQHIGKF